MRFWWLFAACGLLLAVPSGAQDCPDNSAEAGACVTSITLDMDVSYPLWADDSPTVTRVVRGYLTERQTNFLNAATGDAQTGPFGLFGIWFLEVSYEEYQHSDDVRSVLFTSSESIGGLYPLSSVRAFTFNTATDQQIEFTDLFPLETDPFTTLVPLMHEANPELFGHERSEARLMWGGAGPYDAASYRNFVLTEDSIIFIMPPERAGPINAGIFRTEVGLAALSAVIGAF